MNTRKKIIVSFTIAIFLGWLSHNIIWQHLERVFQHKRDAIVKRSWSGWLILRRPRIRRRQLKRDKRRQHLIFLIEGMIGNSLLCGIYSSHQKEMVEKFESLMGNFIWAKRSSEGCFKGVYEWRESWSLRVTMSFYNEQSTPYFPKCKVAKKSISHLDFWMVI